MGSVKNRVGFFLLAFYAATIPTFFYFAFQPVDSATVYAEEAKTASDTLEIPSISLTAPVTTVSLINHKFTVPEQIAGIFRAGEHKIFIIGHSTTIFQNLPAVKVGDSLALNGEEYRIIDTQIQEKSTIDMNKILADTEENTVIIMTCAGEPLGGQDFTHRLIITALSD